MFSNTKKKDAACTRRLIRSVLFTVLSTVLLMLPSVSSAETPKKNPKPAVQSSKPAKPKGPQESSPNNSDASSEKPEKHEDSGDKAKKDSGGGNSLKQVLQESPTSEGGPLYIKSDTLELNSKDHIFTYKGNVEVVRDDVTITADIVEGKYDDKNQLQTILCRQNVVITKGESMRSTANRAVYHVASATIELTEGPELYREGNALAADKVTMYINEDRSEAEGNVRVKVIKSDEAGK